MDDTWRRRDDVSETEMDGDLFLVDGRNGEIYHLDMMGQALWRALTEPVSATGLADLFTQAFPDQDGTQIRRDVQAALAELRNRNLIEPV